MKRIPRQDLNKSFGELWGSAARSAYRGLLFWRHLPLIKNFCRGSRAPRRGGPIKGFSKKPLPAGGIFARVLIVIFFTAAALFLYAQPPSPYLVKIDKSKDISPTLLQLPDLKILQELETYYLGIVPADSLSSLDRSGVSYRVLDRLSDPQARLFLVNLRHPDHLGILAQYGAVWPLEGNDVLFQPFDTRPPREILPDIYRGLKPLGEAIKLQPKPFPGSDLFPPAEPRLSNPLISRMVNSVSKQSLQAKVQTLQDFKTRYATTNGCIQAGKYIYDTLTGAGVQAAYDSFSFEGYSSKNVIGYWPGVTDASSVVILCAHYDSYAGSGSSQSAPGADDNASGTAAVLEAAAIMAQYSFRYSIKFILFSAEEWGFYGSEHYAKEADQRNEKIIGVINMDMISYTDHLPEDLDVITNANSNWLGTVLATAAQNYSTIKVLKTQDGSYYYSDQAPFWDRGFPAVLCIEDYEDTNPYYHTRYDTLDKCNMTFMTEAGKTCLAAAAELAQPQATNVPALTVTSPNGGESWQVGTAHPITWTSTGTVGNVKISLTIDNGTTWTTITSSTANDGSYTWTVPNKVSTLCKIKVSEASDGSPADASDAVFAIVSGVKPNILLNRTGLDFCALASGSHTGTQEVWLSRSNSGTLNWQTGSSASWLSPSPGTGTNDGIITVTVNPAGLAVGAYSGTISVTAANAGNSPQTIAVTLTVKPNEQDMSPFGDFSTPLAGSLVSSSIPVTGWVLDDVGMASVKIYREAGNSLVFIGDAVFIEGARPDIESAYPGYPCNYKAGWGYMMLTNFLPNQGNGTFTFHAVAADITGHEVTLGTRTVTCNNSTAVKPFGALDTPAQGGRASGSAYTNGGWVLTPQPNRIPTNGSTLEVYVDGVNVGTPVYNIYREDIAGLFPGYANSNGAGGYFTLDTTKYANGVHTILWTAVDNAGNADGIGSRYFTILNLSGSTQQQEKAEITNSHARGEAAFTTGHWPPATGHNFVHSFAPLQIKKGFNSNREPEILYPDEKGQYTIQIKELERLVIDLDEHESKSDADENKEFGVRADTEARPYKEFLGLSDDYCGFLTDGTRLKPLPIGSTLDAVGGVFYWQPGPGFLGTYRLVFINAVRADQGNGSVGENVMGRIVMVTILPR